MMGIVFAVIFGLSVLFIILCCFYAIIVRDWKSFFILGAVSFPVSLYALSGEPPIQYAGLFSVSCFAVSMLLFVQDKRKETV